MKVDYFTIPEITVSYKDNVKTSERAVVSSSKDIAKIMAVAFEDKHGTSRRSKCIVPEQSHACYVKLYITRFMPFFCSKTILYYL